MTSLARVIPNTAGTVGRDPRTLLPWSSLSPGLTRGGSSEYTHVMLDVSTSLSLDLTAAARGHTLVLRSGATRIIWVSMWSAAPMEENVGIPIPAAALRSPTLCWTVSIASTRMP